MNIEDIKQYRQAHQDWLEAQYAGSMANARDRRNAIARASLTRQDRVDRLKEIPHKARRNHYEVLARQANTWMGRLYTALEDGTNFVHEHRFIDEPGRYGDLAIRLVNTPALGRFEIAPRPTPDFSYAIHWAYPEQPAVPNLLHSDMRHYYPESVRYIPDVALQVLDDQAETISAICHDAGLYIKGAV